MNNPKLKSFLHSPEFRRLVTKRWRISILLTVIMLSIYFGFILIVAFDKELLATKIGEHITIGLPIGLGVIIAAWLLTGIYVRWANTNYDQEVNRIKSEILKIK